MSLLRLLSMSRSVRPTLDQGHRYRMSARIPNFSQKQPVLLEPKKTEFKKEKDMQTASLFEAAQPDSGETAQAEVSVPGVLSVGVFPKTSSEPLTVVLEKPSWFARFKNIFRRKPRAVEAVPVQTEWSLDRVTVVRNDLSDTDFEVVVAKAGVADAKAKGKSLVGRAWKRSEVAVANPEPVDTLK